MTVNNEGFRLEDLYDPLTAFAGQRPLPGIGFRRAALGDADSIHALIRRAYSHYIPLLGYPPGPMRRDYNIQLFQNPVWLAHTEGSPAALLELIIEPDAVMVEDLAVDPEFQGRKLGSWFMAFAEEVARANGRRLMRLYTNQKMERNIALYRHLGYTETHRAVTEGIPRVFFEKPLKEPRHPAAKET